MRKKKISETFSKIRCVVAFILLNLLCLVPCGIKYREDYLTPPKEECVEVDVEETEPIIRWKAEEEEVSIEPLIVEETTEPQLISLGEFLLTGYCSCTSCSGPHGTDTSTGVTATQGITVAVDPDVIPYGTVLMINGHEYIAQDCGGLVNGKHIDIYFDSHEEANNFKEYTEVFIKRGNSND